MIKDFEPLREAEARWWRLRVCEARVRRARKGEREVRIVARGHVRRSLAST